MQNTIHNLRKENDSYKRQNFEKDQEVTTLQLQVERINALSDQKIQMMSSELRDMISKCDLMQDEKNSTEARFFDY